MGEGALGEIRVLDLSEDVAGPYASKLLAGLGAEVVRIERPDGDASRRRGPFLRDTPNRETSAAFLFLNTGKKSAVLSPETEAGRRRLLGLLEGADVLIESYGPGGLERLNLGPELLGRRFPRLILLRISNFGQDGPYSGFRGSEIVLQALGGLLFLTGDPDKPPLQVGGRQAQYLAGLNAFVALTGALLARDLGGAGALLDLSLHECVAGVLETATHRYTARGEIARRDGNWANRAAWGIYPCADGYAAVVSGDGLMFRRMGELIAALRDARFDSYEERRLYADEINARLLAWLSGLTKEEVQAAGQAQRLPFGAVNRIDEVLQEPQLRARGFFARIDHPIAGSQTYPRAPFRLREAPWATGRAPLLGEHTRAGVGCRVSGVGDNAGVGGQGPGVGNETTRVTDSDTYLSPWGQVDGEPSATEPEQPSSGLLAPPEPVRGCPAADARSASDGTPDTLAHPELVEGRPTPDTLRRMRVLDLTMVWAGPFASKLLADAGAEVLKIESLRHVDSRLWAGFAYKDADPEHPPYARDGYVILCSRNKLGLTLDLGAAAGRALFLRLVAISDVVIENFAAGVMDRLGLDFETLRAVNPGIVMASMPAFGAAGPEADLIAYGTTLEALSGLAGITGYSAEEPHKSGINYGDPVAGLHTAGAILAALHRAQQTGRGELIEVAQLESLTMLLGESILEYSMNGRVAAPIGNADPEMAPQGVYPCAGDPPEADWIAVSIADDAEWLRLVDLLGGPDWARDPSLATSDGRRRHSEQIDANLAAWTATQEQLDLMQRLQAAGIRAGAVLDIAQVLADPHLAARGLFTWREHPDGVAYPLTLNPWRRNGVREDVRCVAPALGEHNAYVFGELLGLSRSEIAELEQEQLIGRLPLLDQSPPAGVVL